MYLVKKQDNVFVPAHAEDSDLANRVRVGSLVFATAEPNLEFRKKLMALIRLGWSNQERIKTFDQYRNLITVAAGFSVTGIGFDGEVRELPRSLSFKEMSAEESQLLYNSILEVISALLVTAPEKIRRELNEYL